jgi:hypothetical protein
MKTQVDTTQRKNKNKNKQSTKTKYSPYAKRIHDKKMTIKNNKKKFKTKELSSVTNWLVTEVH